MIIIQFKESSEGCTRAQNEPCANDVYKLQELDYMMYSVLIGYSASVSLPHFDFNHFITSSRDNMPAIESSLLVEQATSIAPTMGALYIGAMLTAMYVPIFARTIC